MMVHMARVAIVCLQTPFQIEVLLYIRYEFIFLKICNLNPLCVGAQILSKNDIQVVQHNIVLKRWVVRFPINYVDPLWKGWFMFEGIKAKDPAWMAKNLWNLYVNWILFRKHKEWLAMLIQMMKQEIKF